MKQVYYQSTLPVEWYRELHANLPSEISGNRFTLAKTLGQGKLQYIILQEGLWVNQMNFILSEGLVLHRRAKASNDTFILSFYLSDSPILQEGNELSFELSIGQVSILLASAMTTSKMEIPGGSAVRIFNIGFTWEWLEATIFSGQKNSPLKKMIARDKPIYLSENLDFKFKHILNDIDLETHNRLALLSRTFQLLDYFFAKLSKRQSGNTTPSNIHQEDLTHLIKVRNTLDANPGQDISVENLAYNAGMSLSKFKRLFRQVFGETPYQYYLQNKMEKAMEMLVIGRHSVSETGFEMGYANLSQFTKAFKKHFGMLPSEAVG